MIKTLTSGLMVRSSRTFIIVNAGVSCFSFCLFAAGDFTGLLVELSSRFLFRLFSTSSFKIGIP